MGNHRNHRLGRAAGTGPGVSVDRGRRQRTAADDNLEVESKAGPPWKSVRGARVAKGKLLVRDKSYPSKAVLESVAELLAAHLPH